MSSEFESRTREVEIENHLLTEAEVEKRATTHSNFIGRIFCIADVEYPMFSRMALMFFIIAFEYSIMRNAKDAFVLNNQEQASMVFLKYAIIGVAIGAVIFIQYLISKFGTSRVLMGVVIAYIIFFIVFGLILYPNSEKFEMNKYYSMDTFGDGILGTRGFNLVYAFFLIINFWITSLFYILSEIWGNLVLSLLFLSFSNEILTFKQSLRFIPLFYIASNVGLFFSGLIMFGVGFIKKECSYKVNRFAVPVLFIILAICGILYVYIHYSLEYKILPKKIFIPDGPKVKKVKKKVGIIEGLSHCIKSKLLLYFCLIVLAYNITVNIIDSVFKQVMKVQGQIDNLSIDSFTMTTEAQNQMVTAVVVIIALLTPLSRMVQTVGWFFTGMVAPAVSATTSVVALALAIYNTSSNSTHCLKFMNRLFSDFSDTAIEHKLIYWEFQISRISSILFKVTKYAFFDVAKESLSMRINSTMRPTYKAVYDGVIGKLGKAANGIISSGLYTLTNVNEIRNITVFLFFISLILFGMWIYGVWYLSKKYETCVAANTDIDLDYFSAAKKHDKEQEIAA